MKNYKKKTLILVRILKRILNIQNNNNEVKYNLKNFSKFQITKSNKLVDKGFILTTYI